MAFYHFFSFQIQYEITRVRQKIKELALLHDKHMNRPTLDDSSEEEHAIEITTQEITQVQFSSSVVMEVIFVKLRVKMLHPQRLFSVVLHWQTILINQLTN